MSTNISHFTFMSRLRKKLRQISFFTIWLMVWQTMIAPVYGAVTTTIIADPNAARSQQPTVIKSANGITQVNIQTPSAAGVSRNTYKQFDVDASGVILNNSRTDVKTQLGGWISSNPSLAAGSAKVILNEVNSNNPSHLNGYVEIAGQRAEVVIANPSGISISGGGFINASRALLTTGVPNFNSAGGIDGYTVRQGQISVDGTGLDTSGADYTDLISRSMQINAGIWANNLRVTTGANQVDAGNTTAIRIAGAGPAPVFALDSTALGGMYANAITLVGTENGLGVRNAGNIGVSAGNLKVTVDGFLVNSGRMISSGDVAVDTSQGINNSGTMYAGGSAFLTTQGNIANDASTGGGIIAAQGNVILAATGSTSRIDSGYGSLIAAGLKSDGTLSDTGNLSMSATMVATGNGRLMAADRFDLSGSSLDVTGAQIDAKNLNLAATAGDINATGAQLVARDSLKAEASGTLRNDGAILSANQLYLRAHDISNAGGQILQTGSGDLALAVSGAINNSQGTIAGNSQNITISAATLDNTQGNIRHTGSGILTVNAGQSINNTRGAIITNNQLSISASDLDNTGGAIQAIGGNATLAVASLSNAAGNVYAGQNLYTTAGSVTNSGILYAAGNQTLDVASSVTNTGTIAAHGNTSISASTIAGAGTLGAGMMSDGTLSSSGDLTANATGSLTASGQNLAGGSLTFTGGAVDISDSRTSAANIALTADSGNVSTSSATVVTPGNLTVTANSQSGQTLVNRGGVLSADKLSLYLANIDNSGGQIVQIGTHDLSISTAGLNNSRGRIAANAQRFNLTATNLMNVFGAIAHAGTGSLSISAGNIDNSSGVIAGNGNTDISSVSLTNSAGTIEAAGTSAVPVNLSLSISDSLDNSGGTIQAANNTTVQAARIANASGVIAATQDLSVTTAGLSGNGKLLGGRDAVVSLQGDYVATPANLIAANRNLALNVTGAFTNMATLQAGNNLTITAKSIVNDNSDQSSALLAGGKVSTYSDTFTNSSTVIGGELSINANQSIVNSGPKALLGAANAAGLLELLAPVIQNRDDVTTTDTAPQATILGLGNVMLAGGKDENGNYTKASQVLNQSGLIQSGGNLVVYADTLTNTRRILTANTNYGLISSDGGSVVWTSANPDVPGGRYMEPPHGGEWNSDYLYTNYTRNIYRNGINQISPEAHILSGGNFTPVVSSLQNYWSKVTAQGDILLSGVTLDQDSWRGAQSLQELTTTSGQYIYRTYDRRIWNRGWGPINTYAPVTTYESSFTANGSISGSGATITNPVGTPASLPGSIAPIRSATGTSAPVPTGVNTPSVQSLASVNGVNLSLPSGGLYHIASVPHSSYLVESNPLFANQSIWRGSDYYLSQLSYDPATTQKRLGDNFYEQQLVRDQVLKLTGKAVSDGYVNAQAQFEQMYAEGAVVAKNLKLQLGIGLSAEQAASLTSNLILLEERTVDTPSGKQKALVPVVYLAKVKEGDLLANGPLIAGSSISLANTKGFANQGSIVAKNVLNIGMAQGADLNNRGGVLQAGGAMQLSTVDSSIDLTGSGIKAAQLNIESGKDLVLSTAARTITSAEAYGSRTRTDLGRTASIDVTGDTSISAKGDFIQNGGQIKTGGNFTADIGGSYNLGTVAVTDGHNASYALSSASGKSSYTSTQQLTSSVQAGGNSSIYAAKDINAKGATISAQGDIGIGAGGDINLTSAQNTQKLDSSFRFSESGFMSGRRGNGTRNEESTKNIGTGISGKNIVVQSGGSMLMEGSTVQGSGAAVLAANNDITLKEARDTYESRSENNSSKISHVNKAATSTRDYIKQDLSKESLISADTVTVASGKDITIQGSAVAGTGNVKLMASGNVDISASRDLTTEDHYAMHKESGVSASFTGFASGMMKETTSAHSEMDISHAGTVGSTNGSVTISSGKDVKISGSDVLAATTIDVTGQKISLEAAKDIVKTQQSEEYSSTWIALGIGGLARVALGKSSANENNPYGPRDDRQKKLSAMKALRYDADTLGANGNNDMSVNANGMNMSFGFGKSKSESKTEDVTARSASLSAGGNITLATPGTATIEGSSVTSSAGAVNIIADQGIEIREAREKHISSSSSSDSGMNMIKFQRKVTGAVDNVDADTPAGSTVSGQTVTLASSSGGIKVQGSGVAGDKSVTMQSAGPIEITSAKSIINEHHEKSENIYGAMKSGFAAAVIGKQKTKNTTDVTTLTNTGSMLGSTEGDAAIVSGGDVTIKGSNVVTAGDIAITGQNVNLDAAYDEQAIKQVYQWSQSGLRIKMEGMAVSAAESIYDSYKKAKESKDSRLTVLYAMQAGIGAYKAYQSGSAIAANSSNSSNSSDSSRSSSGSGLWMVKVGYSNAHATQITESKSIDAQGSSIQAGNNLTITATGASEAVKEGITATGSSETGKGDINATGASLSGKNITLAANRDINLKSAENSFVSTSNNHSSSFSAGITYSGGYAVGVYVEGAKGKGHENEANLTHTETAVTATDTLTLKSGQDTNIQGGIVKADTIKADIGHNLNIASEQDTATYDYKQENMSGHFQISYGSGSVSASAGASYTNAWTDADHKSVKEQSGLFAGNGGYNINVAGNTDLKGAVIASEATPDKNILTTNTLTYSDIFNLSEYRSSLLGGSVSVSYGSGSNGGNSGGKSSTSVGAAPVIGIPGGDKATGTTRSAVAQGTINTTSDVSDLSRDTKTANGAVSNVFDKEKVATNQEVAKLTAEVGYTLVGEFASQMRKPYNDAVKKENDANTYLALKAKDQSKLTDDDKKMIADLENQGYTRDNCGQIITQAQADQAKYKDQYDFWKDGSLAKIALHTAVGAASAGLGNGNIASTALSAAANETAIPYMAKAFIDAGFAPGSEEFKSLMRIGSSIVGSAVGAATSGNAVSGATIALSATENNVNQHTHTPHDFDNTINPIISFDSEGNVKLGNANTSVDVMHESTSPYDENLHLALGVLVDNTKNNSMNGNGSTPIIHAETGGDFDVFGSTNFKTGYKALDYTVMPFLNEANNFSGYVLNSFFNATGYVDNAKNWVITDVLKGSQADVAAFDAMLLFAGMPGSQFGRLGASGTVAREAEGLAAVGKQGVLESANFAQTTYNASKFSDEGIKYFSNIAGSRIQKVDDLANAIKNGIIKPSEIPIDYVVRDGNTLILNTRSSQALIQANIPRNQWNAVNRTGQQLYEDLLTGQLKRNNLSSVGVPTVRPSGGK